VQCVLVYCHSPVHNQPQSRTSPSPMPGTRFKILPERSVQQKPATDSEPRDRPQRETATDLHHSKQQQLVSGGGSGGGPVGGPGQRATKGQSASDETKADMTSRKVRTVVCDDDYEDDWKKASTVTRRHYTAAFTSAAPQTSQVSSCTHHIF